MRCEHCPHEATHGLYVTSRHTVYALTFRYAQQLQVTLVQHLCAFHAHVAVRLHRHPLPTEAP